MNQTMRVLRAHAWQDAPRIEVAPIPDVASGESLVRIEAAAVSHLDLTVLSGRFDIRPRLPYIGGIEGAGTIVQSEQFAPGSSVAIRAQGLGTTRDGTWAEYVAAPNAALRAIPSELDAGVAATCYSPLTTAYVALHDIGRIGSWDAALADGSRAPPFAAASRAAAAELVAVIGAAGAVGSIATQLALRTGARVIGVVSRHERARLVPIGAETVALSDEAATARLARDQGVTLLVDTVGGAGLAQRLEWVRPGGRAVMVGYTHGTDVGLNLPNWFLRDVALLPVNMLRRERRAGVLVGDLTRLLLDGVLTLDVETHSMAAAADAFARLRDGRVRGRLALTWSEA